MTNATARIALGLLLLPLMAAPAAAVTTDDYPRSCAWAAADDPNAINVAYPDEGANYWGSILAIPPGATARFTGEFPHARYMSFNAYDPSVSPVDAIADVQIVPADGSDNPFLPGADRTVTDRQYTVTITGEPAPEDPNDREENTVYAGFADQDIPGFGILYRVYVPDDGRDPSGGVGLPRLSIELADGTIIEDEAQACTILNVTGPPTVNELQESGDLGDPPGDSVGARDVLAWRRFFNLPLVQGEAATGNTPFAPVRGTIPASNNGGYLSNVHNTYAYTIADRALGPVVVLEGRAPTVPSTLAGQPVMGDGQLRYWSLCQNERQSTRFIGCTYDEVAVLGGNGSFTTVMSTPEDRPANATEECGVNWLPWGAQPEGLLTVRQMLARPDFVQTFFKVDTPYEIDAVVGEYLPRGNHLSGPAQFEERGCPANFDLGGFDADPTTVDAVDGATPEALAVAVSRARFGGNAAGRAVLARSDRFGEMLAATGLTLDAPLLLTPDDTVPAAVRTELDRAADDTATIYIVGGTDAISQTAEDELTDAGYNVVRLTGATPIEIAVAIAREVRRLYPAPESTRVVLAGGFGPADDSGPSAPRFDAMAVGGLAAAYHAPILLTATDELSPVTAAALEEFDPTETIVVGDAAAVSEGVLEAAPASRRVAGDGPAGAAAALVAEWTPTRDRFVLTDGVGAEGGIAAVLGAGMSADAGAPQLLTDGGRVTPATSTAPGFCTADVLTVGAPATAQRLDASARCTDGGIVADDDAPGASDGEGGQSPGQGLADTGGGSALLGLLLLSAATTVARRQRPA